nr:glycine-rich RNA-binding protein GRP2A-like [Arachis hypogaea]
MGGWRSGGWLFGDGGLGVGVNDVEGGKEEGGEGGDVVVVVGGGRWWSEVVRGGGRAMAEGREEKGREGGEKEERRGGRCGRPGGWGWCGGRRWLAVVMVAEEGLAEKGRRRGVWGARWGLGFV